MFCVPKINAPANIFMKASFMRAYRPRLVIEGASANAKYITLTQDRKRVIF